MKDLFLKLRYNFQWYVLGMTPFHYEAKKDSKNNVITDENGIPIVEKAYIEPFERTPLDIRVGGIPLIPIFLIIIIIYLFYSLIKLIKK